MAFRELAAVAPPASPGVPADGAHVGVPAEWASFFHGSLLAGDQPRPASGAGAEDRLEAADLRPKKKPRPRAIRMRIRRPFLLMAMTGSPFLTDMLTTPLR